MGKYVRGQAKVPGADKFYSSNEFNQKYINSLYNSESSNGAAGYTGNISFNVATSSDAARLYRYNPETKTLVRDFYDEDADRAYDSDPSLHYKFIDSKDLSEIMTGKYFYFNAGSSEPVNVQTGKPIKKSDFGDDPDFWAAVESMKKERAGMDPKKLSAEVKRHKAQVDAYDIRRTLYLFQEIVGSSVANTGSDFDRDFAQYINNGLEKMHPGVDYNYHCENNRLTEYDIVAMTILSYGNPDVTGKCYHSLDPMASAVGVSQMWPSDLFLERVGKLNFMLDWHASVRLDAKKNIEAFDASGDITILAKAVANGIFATAIGNNHKEELSINAVGSMISALIVNDFLKKPGLLEAAKAEAEKLGKTDEFNTGLALIERQCHECKFYKELIDTNLRIANLIDGREDEISPDETQKELNRLEDASSVNKTVIDLFNYTQSKKSGLFAKYSSSASAAVFEKMAEEMERINADSTISEVDKINLRFKISEGITTDSELALNIDSSDPFEQLAGTPGGIDLLRDFIKRSKLRTDSDNIPEVSEKLIVLLEKSGIIPARPSEMNQASVDSYRAALDSYDAGIAVSRYNIEKLFAKPDEIITLPVDKDFARTDEDVSAQRTHEKISADMLASGISAEPGINELEQPVSEIRKYLDYGKKYEKGLFAPETDSSDMFFGLRGKNLEIKMRNLKSWQADIDQVVIPHSDRISDRLIEIAVFGNSIMYDRTKDEGSRGNLETAINFAKEKLGDGTTIPEGYEDKASMMALVFDNMFKDDVRYNTQTFRGCVAAGRKAIRDDVNTGSTEKLKASIKNAFDNYLTYCLAGSNPLNPDWVYCARKIDEIRDALRNKEIDNKELSLKDIGVTDRQLEQCKIIDAKHRLVSHYIKNQDIINKYLPAFKASNGTSELTNPKYNPELYNAFVECIATSKIFKELNFESSAITNIFESDHSIGFDYYAEREATPTEELLIKDPDGLLQYYKDRIADDSNYKNLTSANDYSTLLNIYNNHGILHLDSHDGNAMNGAVAFEKAGAKSIINNSKKVLETVRDEIHGKTFTDDTLARRLVEEEIGLLEKLEAERNKIKDFSKVESIQKLKPIYGKLRDNLNEIYKCINRNEPQSKTFSNNISLLQMLSTQSKRLDAYDSIAESNRNMLRIMANSKKMPNSANNLEKSLNLVNKLCEGSTIGKPLQDFKEHLSTLNTMMKGSFGDDSAVSERIKARDVADMYHKLIEDINTLETTKTRGLSDKLKFVITGIKTSVSEEYRSEIQPVEACEGSFRQAYADNIAKTSAANIAHEKQILDGAIKRLESVSTRTGGNSKEFQAMLNSAKAMELSLNDRNALREASDKLFDSASSYIAAKGATPSTGKGQSRLKIAKELRDISRSLVRDTTADMSRETRERYFTKGKTASDKLKEKIDFITRGVRSAWEAKNATALVSGASVHQTWEVTALLNGVSALVYLNVVSNHSKELGDKRMAEMLSPERIKASVREINQLSTNVLKHIDDAAFDKAVKSNSFTAFIVQNFEKYGPMEVKKLKRNEAAQKSADKADDILAKPRKTSSVRGMGL